MLSRRAGSLACESVPLEGLAAAVGTPAWVYSAASVREQFGRLDEALRGVPHRIHYSLKANANGALLRLLRSLGAGADVVSGGELFRALHAGFQPGEIIFGGVGKTEGELAQALDAKIRLINVESEAEVRLVDRLAEARGRRAGIALRVNPEITIDNPHAYIRTGGKGHKFGIPWDEVVPAAEVALGLRHVQILGLDMHVGSQLARLDTYAQGLARMIELCEALRQCGVTTLRYLDIGGGLAVPYEDERPPDLTEYGAIVRGAAEQTGLEILVEPGRFLVARAGILLTRVLYRKRSGGREIAVTDAGMTELLRPSHYQAYHHIEPVTPREGSAPIDIVGPVCESGDFLALARELPELRAGDLLAVHTAGAYGSAMASTYNARPRAAEVLVDGGRWAVTTERETYEDLVRHEHVSLDWRSV
ncbi:MAG TPA: diaminopimelate decarboxylase [Gemmatimonadaceae bacterium]|nr:diaminopimelate decarboxylase [Gemmatimonadaceae bacterium]